VTRGTKTMKPVEAPPARADHSGLREEAVADRVVNGDGSDRGAQLPVRAESSVDQNLVRRELLREIQDVRDEMKAMYDDGERSRNRQAEHFERKRVELIKFVATTFNDMGQRIGTLVGGSEAS